MVEEKAKAMHKYYITAIFREFIQFFKLPKILLTLFFGVGTFYLFSFFNNGYFIGVTFIISLIVIPIYKGFLRMRKMKLRNKTTQKRWMVDNFLMGSGTAHYLILTPFQVWSELIFKPNLSQNALIFLTCSFILSHLIYFVTSRVVRPSMQQKMAKLYPEYEIV